MADFTTLAVDNLDAMNEEDRRVCEYAVERLLDGPRDPEDDPSFMQNILRERLRRNNITSNG